KAAPAGSRVVPADRRNDCAPSRSRDRRNPPPPIRTATLRLPAQPIAAPLPRAPPRATGSNFARDRSLQRHPARERDQVEADHEEDRGRQGAAPERNHDLSTKSDADERGE